MYVSVLFTLQRCLSRLLHQRSLINSYFCNQYFQSTLSIVRPHLVFLVNTQYCQVTLSMFSQYLVLAGHTQYFQSTLGIVKPYSVFSVNTRYCQATLSIFSQHSTLLGHTKSVSTANTHSTSIKLSRQQPNMIPTITTTSKVVL